MNQRIRILQVVGETNRGGTETWLLHTARALRQSECAMDFLVHSAAPGAYDAELRKLGCRIVVCPQPRNLARYGPRLLQILRENRYDVVHSHIQFFTGIVLTLARIGRVPVRVAHAHNAGMFASRRLYQTAMMQAIRRSATHGLATSALAAENLFGQDWRDDRRWGIHYSCVNLDAFAEPRDASLRGRLGVPSGAIVVGHVGRFFQQKNQSFLLDVAAELLRLDERYFFVMKGEGPLRPEAARKARHLGIDGRCLFLDAGDDVPQLQRGAFDAFLFPSLYEGLGLALIEAQAAGLRCFASDRVPPEAAAIPELVDFISLRQPASEWAARIHAVLEQPSGMDPAEALQKVRESGFDIRRSAAALLEFYRSVVSATANNHDHSSLAYPRL